MGDCLVTIFSSNDTSGSTEDLKNFVCTQVQYGGKLMPIGTDHNRYSACKSK